ncbi:MAG: acetyl-coenzyme A synthetase N-terminal domain-containing protein, partial [Pseudomonadota bacterium]
MTVEETASTSTPNTRPIPTPFAARAHIDASGYARMYGVSVSDPEGFWGEQGKRIDWITPYTKVKNTSFSPGNIDI